VTALVEGGARRRNLPAPPHAVAESLCEPDRDPARPWLHLRGDEQRPAVVEKRGVELVVWSSLWQEQPEALIRFELAPQRGGTDLLWTLLVAERPDASRLGHYRQRINQLIHAGLRSSYGQ